MLSNARQNYHNSKLPEIGAIGKLVSGHDRYGSPHYLDVVGDRWIVTAFPLVDSPEPYYSVGIHTIYIRNLRNGQEKQVSGFWLSDD